MKSIPAQEIKRRGISVVDELLQDGPVQVIRHNRPRYVVMTIDTYERITAGASAWDWPDKPADRRGYASRSKTDIDAALRRERDVWDDEA